MNRSLQLLTEPRATAFLFPGQGSQHVGMTQDLAATYSAARHALEEADDVLGFHLSRLMAEGPEADLVDTVNAQPALLAAGYATLLALQEEVGLHGLPLASPGTVENVTAGHSLGEYTALVAAGAMAYADGLRLVRTRGQLMKDAGLRSPGMMAAILGLDEAQVAEICRAGTASGGIAQVANDNCPGQVVISGDQQGMESVMAALVEAGARKVIPLAVSIAAHSPLMQPAANRLRTAIEESSISSPKLAVYANTTAQPLLSKAEIRDELAAQLTGSVRWTSSVQAMSGAGITTFVEVGPGEVLTGLVKRIERQAARYSVRDVPSLQEYVASLQA
jgi:[acyl-carrier-protein] S-malonyltransferase